MNGGVFKDIHRFFDREATTLKLNRTNCAQVSLEQVGQDGFKMLGTDAGPAAARRAFLNGKIDLFIDKLDKLQHLSYRHVLVLLRQCIQQDIRHVQRTLETDDIADAWDRFDARLGKGVERMTARGDKDSASARNLLNLPACLGGVGILSYKNCAPLARQAATEEPDTTSDNILGPALDGGRREGTGSVTVKSQGERCKEM